MPIQNSGIEYVTIDSDVAADVEATASPPPGPVADR